MFRGKMLQSVILQVDEIAVLFSLQLYQNHFYVSHTTNVSKDKISDSLHPDLTTWLTQSQGHPWTVIINMMSKGLPLCKQPPRVMSVSVLHIKLMDEQCCIFHLREIVHEGHTWRPRVSFIHFVMANIDQSGIFMQMRMTEASWVI